MTRSGWSVAASVMVSVAALLCHTGAASAQGGPPQLVALSLTPDPVDVTAAAQPLTLTLGVADDLSGTSEVCVVLQSPTGTHYLNNCGVLTSGTVFNGTWTVAVPIPQFSEAGTWVVDIVELFARDGQVSSPQRADLEALGLPNRFTVISPNPDNTPPQLTAFTVTPSSIDVSSGAKTVTLTIGLQDLPAGVNFDAPSLGNGGPVGLRSPSGQFIDDYFHNSNLVSGTAQNGLWSLAMTVPPGAEAGTWSVAYLGTSDSLNNNEAFFSSVYCAPLPPDYCGPTTFESLGFSSTFTVSSTSTPPPDTVAPQLVSASLSAGTVDVTVAPQTLRLTTNVTDDLSGTASVCTQIIGPSDQVGNDFFGLHSQSGCARLTMNSVFNGTWAIDFVIPQFAEAGAWRVAAIFLQDVAGNVRALDTSALAALGLPTTFNVIAASDVTPPQLTSLSVSPSAIDVSNGASSVTVTIGLQDSPAGVDFDQFGGGAISLRSPSGKQTVGGAFRNSNMVSGTAQNGVWSLVVTVPQDAEAGTWSVGFLTVLDHAGNFQTIYSNDDCLVGCEPHFEALGFSPLFTVISAAYSPPQPDLVPPKLVTESLSANTVDVTAAGQTLTMTLNVTDDLSGVKSVCAMLIGPAGTNQGQRRCGFLSAGTGLNGTWTIVFPIPQFAAAGTWTVETIFLQDGVTNSTIGLTSDTLVLLGLPVAVTVVSNPDLTPPRLTSLALTPSSIDVSSGARSVTLTLGVQDSPSGVTFGDTLNPVNCYAALRSPSGKQVLDLCDVYPNATLVSGTPQNGVWQLVKTIPRDAEAGTWSINSITLSDRAGNTQPIYSDDYCGMCEPTFGSLGLSSTVAVTSSTPDLTPPVLTGLTVTPVVDTSSGPATLTVTLSATDDLTGLDFVTTFPEAPPTSIASEIRFVSPHNQFLSGGASFQLISGTRQNGTWQLRLTVPRYSEGGDWRIDYVHLRDRAGNVFSVSTPSLFKSLGLPSEFVVIPSLTPACRVPSPTSCPGSLGGTVHDPAGSSAALTLPAGAVAATTTVALATFSPTTDFYPTIDVPSPNGFSLATVFFDVQLSPEPTVPFPLPGATITVPLYSSRFGPRPPSPPGTKLFLFTLDPVSGTLDPAPSVFGGNVSGTVDASGTSATFAGLAAVSLFVGLLPSGVAGDVNGDGQVDCADVAIVTAAFGSRTGQAQFDPRADITNNGVVDVSDLTFVTRQLPSGMVCR